MNCLVVSGSPRARGRSAALAQAVARELRAADPAAQIEVQLLADLRISPCTGCGFCEGSSRHDPDPRAAGPCVIADDMAALRSRLDACDELVVVAPVYFAGPPAQLKALFDRLQPYFWADWRHTPKRPADLYVVGEGGDPHGFAPLVGSARSALAVAGFRLRDVHDWVGELPERPASIAHALTGGRVRPAADFQVPGL